MKTSLIAMVASVCAAQAFAAPVTPVSYDMVNGWSGSFNYWDDSYSGSGNTQANGAALSGGTGDLTDGYIETQNWNLVEGPRGPNGPYVGWLNINPTIDFTFDKVYDFLSVTFWVDDSDGTGFVFQPGSVTVEGVNYLIPTNPGSAPFSYTVDLTGYSGSTLSTQLFRGSPFGSGWIFMSEVSFEVAAPAVPVPASGLLLVAGLGGIAALRRRATA